MSLRHSIVMMGTLACASLGHAQAVSLSGVVQNSEGATIEGATVHLRNAGLTTTTGPDGAFVIEHQTGLIRKTRTTAPMVRVLQLPGSHLLSVYLPGEQTLSVTTYSAQGRVLFRTRRELGAGHHTIALPPLAEGVYFHAVAAGARQSLFQYSTLGGSSNASNTTGPATARFSGLSLSRTAADTVVDTLVVKQFRYATHVRPLQSYVLDLGPIVLTDAVPHDGMVRVPAGDAQFEMGSNIAFHERPP